jgi:hypothetical protein
VKQLENFEFLGYFFSICSRGVARRIQNFKNSFLISGPIDVLALGAYYGLKINLLCPSNYKNLKCLQIYCTMKFTEQSFEFSFFTKKFYGTRNRCPIKLHKYRFPKFSKIIIIGGYKNESGLAFTGSLGSN